VKILEGQLPEGVEWRVLVVLEPGQQSRLIQQIGLELARANRGEVVAAVVVREEDKRVMEEARHKLAEMDVLLSESNAAALFPVIISGRNYESVLAEVIKEVNIDLLLVCADPITRHDYRKIPCAVGMLRTAPDAEDSAFPEARSLNRILVSTSGGPNSAYALGLLLPLTPKVELSAFYVATSRLAENDEALGHARLNQVVDFVDAGERIQKKLAIADTVAEGIIEEASDDYHLVVIGASEESRIDQVIFGNIPALVVEQCHKPVLVIRRGLGRLNNAITLLDWRMQSIVPRKTLSERAAIYARIRRGARPETSFFVLIGLSAMIASLGLIVNSPAVVIGAMLVAPLMSPIIGTGLALVLGDTRFLRLSLGAVNRGVLLAIAVGMLAGLTALNRPFSNEILARTQPSLYDLAIALFSGAAAAYALSFSQAAGALPGVAIAAALVPPLATVGITLSTALAALVSGRIGDGWDFLTDSLGALLLFTTNFIAISSAAAGVFFILGFRPTPSQKARIEVQRRNARIALGLLIAVGIVLGLTGYLLARETAMERRIYTVTEEQVAQVLSARLDELEILEYRDRHLRLGLTVFSPAPVPQSQISRLQQHMTAIFVDEGIATDLGLTIAIFEYTELPALTLPTPPVSPALP
jgi:uncharacterized hydrophobic protein (TIGR00271 family)